MGRNARYWGRTKENGGLLDRQKSTAEAQRRESNRSGFFSAGVKATERA